MGTRTLGAAIAMVLFGAAAQSNAAVTVLGNRVASSCYQFAEFGGSAKDGVATCSFAIEQEALSPRDRAATFINRGILRSRMDDPGGALNDYDAGLSIDETLAEGYVDRGAVLIVLRRYEDALRNINRGLEMGARRPQIAYYDRAIVNEALGNVRAAYEDYKKAVELAPDFKLASEQLTRFKVIRKRTDGT